MTSDEIHEKLNQGYNDYLEGKNFKANFTNVRKQHRIDNSKVARTL